MLVPNAPSPNLNYNYVTALNPQPSCFDFDFHYIPFNMIKPKHIAAFIDLAFFPFKNPSIPSILIKNPKYFVNQSKFYKPQIPIEQLLNQNQIEYNDSASNVFRLKHCPFCKKPHRDDPSNLYTLNVNKQNGLYYCHRCSSKGSYLDLKKALLGINVDPIINEFLPTGHQSEQQQIISQAEYFIYTQNMKKQEFKDVKEYLHSRGLKDEVIAKYNIGSGYEIFSSPEGQSISVKVIYFPMQKFLSAQEQKRKLLKNSQDQIINAEMSSITELAKLKVRGVGKQNKKYMRQYPPGPARGLFGLNTVKKNDKMVVITEGEFDAMSVNQITGLLTLSLPQGANSLPDTILPYLDQFQKIVLWMDNDDAGKLNIEKFSQKLGISRTHIVSHSFREFKDANDFLQKKPQMISELIKKARSIPDQNIVQFNLIREKIKDRIMNEKQFQGLQLSNFNFFNKKVKGIRPAQVSVISGGTGSGKTTLLSQISIDMSRNKIPVLWGSFEIRNQILITNMLQQFSEENLKKNKNRFDFVADQFSELPLYYMSFHGSNNVNKVLGTITYAIERYGVTFVVIDTLQFFLSGQGEGYKKFDMQDYVMAELRTIATTYNVHIAVVIHPRKTEDNEDIGIHSIYGTSKATQEADNIWVIQNRDGFKIFDIKKNRYDGDVGRVAMGFNKNSKTFFQLKKKELESLFTSEKTIHDIIEDREAEKQEKSKSIETGENWLDLEDEFSTGDQPQLGRQSPRRKY